jgi:hypothetical protein
MQAVRRNARRVHSLNLISDGYSSDNVMYEVKKRSKHAYDTQHERQI